MWYLIDVIWMWYESNMKVIWKWYESDMKQRF